MKRHVKIPILTTFLQLSDSANVEVIWLKHNKWGNYLKILLSIFLLGLNSNVQAGMSDPPETSTSNPKYYVIQSADTKGYVTYNSGLANHRITLESSVADEALWYFEAASNGGVKIVSKALAESNDKYLTSTRVSATSNLGVYSSTGTVFYINPNPYDVVGCVVSTSQAGSTNCWKTDKVGSNCYLVLDDLSNDEGFKWIFKSYDDLLEEAEENGVDISTYKTQDKTSGANFNSLINAINTAKNSATAQSLTSGKKYLLKNRRYGYYLNSNGTSFYGASTPTDYSTWEYQNSGTPTLTNVALNVSIGLINASGNDAPSFTLNTSRDEVFNATVIKSSDGDSRFIAFNGITRGTVIHKTYYFAMVSSKTIEGREGQSFSSDWELIEAVEGENYDHVILSEDELMPENYESNQETYFFRIRNVGRDVKNYAADKQFDGGGWLEDVDHTHFEFRKEETSSTAAMFVQEEAELFYTAKDAEVYVAMPDMTHASALWEFIPVGRASTSNENATGLVSPEHNIYIVRNANTGKYIFGESLTENQNDATKFYLTKLVDGQYAFNVYSGTNSSGADSNSGAIRVTKTGEGYHGGLTLSNETAIVNTNSAWLIMPAPTLALNIMTMSTAEDPSEWSTFYYPFDVKPTDLAEGRSINIFQGGWSKEPTDGKTGVVKMIEVEDVPAGNPVFVRTNMNNGESFGPLMLKVYPANSGKLVTDASVFEGNAWEGIVESEGHYFGESWKDYWILNRNSKGELKLLHPAGNYLLPNRAYISNNSAQQSYGVNVRLSYIDMIIPGDEGVTPSGIDHLRVNVEGIDAIYH